jgi:hypothetical protein
MFLTLDGSSDIHYGRNHNNPGILFFNDERRNYLKNEKAHLVLLSPALSRQYEYRLNDSYQYHDYTKRVKIVI